MKDYTSSITSKITDHDKALVNKSVPVSNVSAYFDAFRTPGELKEDKIDVWNGDINSIPFEPTNESLAMEQMD